MVKTKLKYVKLWFSVAYFLTWFYGFIVKKEKKTLISCIYVIHSYFDIDAFGVC